MHRNLHHFRSGIYIIAVAVFLIMLPGCAAKRYAKKAAKFEEAGLYKDAAGLYYKSVERNRTKVEPKLGLRKNGQLVLNDLLVDFEADYKRDETESAVYSYRTAKKYYDKLKVVGVDLSFPEKYNEFYNDVKNSFLAQKYTDGLEKINRKEYDKAARIFREVVEISPNYKDVQKQLKIAVYEPIYQQANKLYYSGKPRSAYQLFDKITRETSGYKDAQSMKDRAREDAVMNILITQIRVLANSHSFSTTATEEKISQAINDQNNPFIRIIDKSALDESVMKKVNGEYNMKALNLAGISAILKVEVKSIKQVTGKTRKETKPAYIKIVQTYKDENGHKKKVVKYKKTTYKSYRQTNYVYLDLSYKLLDTETGSVLLAGSYADKKSDSAHFGRYDGNINDLVPGSYKNADEDNAEDQVDDRLLAVRKLHQLLRASDQIATSAYLLKLATNEAVDKIAMGIDNFNPEK